MVGRILPYIIKVSPFIRANCAPVRTVGCTFIRSLRLSYISERSVQQKLAARILRPAWKKLYSALSLREKLIKMRTELSGEEKELRKERYQLSMERIAAIQTENSVKEPFLEYFHQVAGFLLLIKELDEKKQSGELDQLSFAEYQIYNRKLYEDILPDQYVVSYANPAYAVQKLGKEYGQLLSFVYTELRALIADVYEGNEIEVISGCEFFVELYNLFEAEGTQEEIFHAVYWFLSDYSDVIYAKRILSACDPSFDFAEKIVMERDLEDLRYLFAYGEYITDIEIKCADFCNRLPEETVETIAAVFVDGYRRGFENTKKDLSLKKIVQIRFPIGFERIIRKAVQKFAAFGLKPVFFRYALHSVEKRKNQRIGYTATPANRQYDYDHCQDEGLYFDKAFFERKKAVLAAVYYKNAEFFQQIAGPAVFETFGEEPFAPVCKPEAVVLSKKQQKLMVDFSNISSQISEQYIPSKETSFTIIAFPTPEIGEHFEEIFRETIRINTLDYIVYQRVQQCLIDALDNCEFVRIVGANGNQTDLTVALKEISDPRRETRFENCLADVNIPLGEVFTSPKLYGTNGILHVKEVFLRGLKFQDFSIRFQDGCICDYHCSNFSSEEENRAYIKNHLLQGHDTLPMGEFAIGTNTAAYAMAKKYGIIRKLPILIVEKMGPHFAVGDTCYSWEEDVLVYNPDGKEMIAKENTFSMLRKTDPNKAYFHCHTDITIPYEEIGEIACCQKDGKKVLLIADGKFVLPGTELLNEM